MVPSGDTPVYAGLGALRVLASAALAVLLGSRAVYPLAAPVDSVPVMVGGEADLDACGSIGVISGPYAHFGATVRSGPGAHYAAIEYLPAEAQVWLCDRQGRWVGVVYGPEGQDCGVASPLRKRGPYAGRCASGWVIDKTIKLLAG